MAEKIIKKAEEFDVDTIVECNDLKVIKGDLNSSLWIMKVGDKLKAVVDADEYMEFLENLNNLLNENLELRLERAILSQFPIDYEDVKAVVLEEMKKDKNKSIEEIVNKVKLEHPNLFYNLEIDNIL